jgi:hypothetical protein
MTKLQRDTINRNKCIAFILSNFYCYCPNLPEKLPTGGSEMMRMKFSRYTARTLYYAESFLNKYDEILRTKRGKAQISLADLDPLYFDFDAFIFSISSMLDGNILQPRGKYLHASLKEPWLEIVSGIKEYFKEPFLDSIRNEVVHLNELGTAIHPQTSYKNNRDQFFTNHSTTQDLVALFKDFLGMVTPIINDISTLLIRNDCEKFGYPTKDIIFQYFDCSIKASHFIVINKSRK